MNLAIHGSHAAYYNMMFKEALKTGYYDLQNARDAYRAACGPHGMHTHLVHRYIKVSSLYCSQWDQLEALVVWCPDVIPGFSLN